jgi:hypothetical protein
MVVDADVAEGVEVASLSSAEVTDLLLVDFAEHGSLGLHDMINDVID